MTLTNFAARRLQSSLAAPSSSVDRATIMDACCPDCDGSSDVPTWIGLYETIIGFVNVTTWYNYEAPVYQFNFT